MSDFHVLFTPFQLAGKTLRNRVVHASMSLLATPAGRVTDRMIRYHANRYATPRLPNDALAAPLRAAGIEVIAVGDARAPQEMLFATASGHAAGESV